MTEAFKCVKQIWQICMLICIFFLKFHRHSQGENEKRIIASVSADGMSITLTRPLNYTHLGITVTLPDGTVFEARAEVGLLTRNILIRGSENVEWNDKIPSCPDGFDTGILPIHRMTIIMLIFKTC